MGGFRVSFGVVVSLGLHLASLTALNRPAPLPIREPLPPTIELTELPPATEPEPPPPPQEPPPPPVEPAKVTPPQRITPSVPRAAVEPQPEPSPPVAPQTAPLLLAGITMSNVGIGVPQGYGTQVANREAVTASALAPRTPAAVAAPRPPTLTPLSDLSKKPVAPQLDAALAHHYPAALRAQGVEGQALLRVVLTKDGRVAETRAVSESHPGFATACTKALQGSRWGAPIDKQGNPTRTELQYRCRFQINL